MCKGTGKAKCDACDEDDDFTKGGEFRACPKCSPSGKRACPECHGKGCVPDPRRPARKGARVPLNPKAKKKGKRA
jgi:hypothetical protein